MHPRYFFVLKVHICYNITATKRIIFVLYDWLYILGMLTDSYASLKLPILRIHT